MDRAAGCSVDVLRTDAQLDALKADWDALYERSQPRNPFLSFDWTRACRRFIAPHSRLFTLVLREDRRLIGIAPLRLDRELGFRVLRFVGDGRSDYLGFLCDPERPAVGEQLLQELARRRPEWDLAVLRNLTPPYATWADAGSPAGLCSGSVEGTVAPYVAHAGDWSSLCAHGPGWLKRMRKRVRRFLESGGTVERYRGVDALAQLDSVAEIEAASWKGQQGVARFQPGAGQELLRDALESLGARGELELWLARVEGRPVAYGINFLTPERIWLYQGAFREDHRRLGVGSVLEHASIQDAWERGIREYDYMSGDEPYKSERTDAKRTLWYRALYPESVRGYLAYALLVAPRWRIKKVRGAHAALQLYHRVKNNPFSFIASGA